MTIRERLENLRPIAGLIKGLEQERERTRATLVLCPSLWEEWETLHQDSISELRAEQQATLDLIGRLDHQIDREALLARYQDGLTWDEVAQRLQYSASNLKRRHKLALEQLEGLDD